MVLWAAPASAEGVQEMSRRRGGLGVIGRRGERVVLLVGVERRVERLRGRRLVRLGLVLRRRRQGRCRKGRRRRGRESELVGLLLLLELLLGVGGNRGRVRVVAHTWRRCR